MQPLCEEGTSDVRQYQSWEGILSMEQDGDMYYTDHGAALTDECLDRLGERAALEQFLRDAAMQLLRNELSAAFRHPIGHEMADSNITLLTIGGMVAGVAVGLLGAVAWLIVL
jgi:hypothetical protein